MEFGCTIQKALAEKYFVSMLTGYEAPGSAAADLHEAHAILIIKFISPMLLSIYIYIYIYNDKQTTFIYITILLSDTGCR